MKDPLKKRHVFTLFTLLLAAMVFSTSCNKGNKENRSTTPVTGMPVGKRIGIANRYDQTSVFMDGLAIVSHNNKYGCIDIYGNEIVPCTDRSK